MPLRDVTAAASGVGAHAPSGVVFAATETGAARVFRGLADAPMEATLIEAVHQGKLKVTTEASTQVLANSL